MENSRLALVHWGTLCQVLALLLLATHQTCSKTHQTAKEKHLPVAESQLVQTFYKRRDWSNKIGSSNFTYASLAAMLNRKNSLTKSIGDHVKSIQQQSSITPAVHLKMNLLLIYQRELKAAENSLMTVLKDLNQTMSNSDYRSIENIKRSCRVRQDHMRNAAILVEEDYNTILSLERETAAQNPNNSSLQSHFKLVNEFLTEISQAADELESNLVEDIFSDYKNIRGAEFETVVKLREDSLHEHDMKRVQDHTQDGGDGEGDGTKGSGRRSLWRRKRSRGNGISMLIDSSSNQYILSRPRDVTFPVEDHHFIHDIINLLLLSFVFGGLCSVVTVPPLFGYIFAGMCLGPTGWNLVGSVVQVESLGEIGVIFVVFTVGLDFSFKRLQKVWRVAVYGGNLLLVSSLLLGILLGVAFQVHPRHSLFVAACLSFSSNPLATRIVNKTSSVRQKSDLDESEDSEWNAVDSVRGVLLMQDVQLGFLMALLPFFEGGKDPTQSAGVWLLQLLQVLFGLPVLVLLVRSLATRVIGKFYRRFSHVLTNPENILLGSIALCLGTVLVAEMLSGSLELGCFLAGVIISSRGSSETEQVKRLTGPIRDLFAVFFFASIGFHVYPTFLKSEFTTMASVMICIVTLKFVLCVVVLGLFLGHCSRHTLVISVSLAQVSEFSFVVSSRARRMGIISREVYLVILSITTLSLLLSPLLWRVFLLHQPSAIIHSSLLSPAWASRACHFFTNRFTHVHSAA